jgi:hypothetical protein
MEREQWQFIVEDKENYDISRYLNSYKYCPYSDARDAVIYENKLNIESEIIYRNFNGKIKSRGLSNYVSNRLNRSLYLYGIESWVLLKKKAIEGTLTVEDVVNIQQVLDCKDQKLIKAFEEFCNY